MEKWNKSILKAETFATGWLYVVAVAHVGCLCGITFIRNNIKLISSTFMCNQVLVTFVTLANDG